MLRKLLLGAVVTVALSTAAFAQAKFGTADEAKAMLTKAVAAVKADKPKAIDMFVKGGQNNETGWSSEKYDELIRAAAAEPDAKKRMDIFRQAEEILMDEVPIFPIYSYVSLNLVHSYVKGFDANVQDTHPLHLISIDKEERDQFFRKQGLTR